jgi:CheY-like chemotaxis protein
LTGKNLLENKSVLIVDDEPDILDTLEEMLPECVVVRASTFEEAKDLLESRYFDLAILDIMGVEGYQLLDIAVKRGVTAVMLTANALSPEDTVKSYEEGAAYYIPKDEMADIGTMLNEILEAQEKGESPWSRWLHRFGSFYERRFGPDWQKKDKDFWEKFVKRYSTW